MINVKALQSMEDFELLSKGDTVACEWKLDSYKNGKRTRFASYEVVENKKSAKEIILETKNNVYFNYEMFLSPEIHGVSNIKSIMKLWV